MCKTIVSFKALTGIMISAALLIMMGEVVPASVKAQEYQDYTQETSLTEGAPHIGADAVPVAREEYTEDPSPSFTRRLYRGMTNPEVSLLQKFLISVKYLASEYVTGFFGALTEKALKEFQCDTNIVCEGDMQSTGWGTVGERTRSSIRRAPQFAALLLGSAAPTVQSAKSGLWSDPTVWSTGTVPEANAVVNIPAGVTVTYDVISSDNIAEVQVYGTLSFSRTTSTQLDVGSLLVLAGGTLEIGTEANPIPSTIKVTIKLVDLPTQTYTHLHGQTRLQPVLHTHGGTLDIHGAPIINTWTILTQNAALGATTLTVKDSISDWKAGDTIIVTGTNKLATPAVFQVEEATIASVSGNTITLTAPLKNTHLGTFPRQATVGLLTHNVVITSKDPAGRRGSVHMSSGFSIPDSSPAPNPIPDPVIGRISNAEFSHLGRSEPGVYPVHFHRLGNGGKNSYIKSSSITHTKNLCVRVHGTNFLTVDNNVCYDSLGHGYTTEDGTEVYNTFNRNLASRTKGNIPTNPNDPSDVNEGSGFWINNARNSLTNNYASDANAWGYQVDPITTGVIGSSIPFISKVLPIVDQSGNPTAPVAITSLEILSFKGNTSYSSVRGGAEIVNLDTAGQNRVIDFHSIDAGATSIAAFASTIIFDDIYVNNGVLFYTPGNNSPIIVLTKSQSHQFLNSNISAFSTGYQFGGTVLFDKTNVTTLDKGGLGGPTLYVVTGSPRAKQFTVDTANFAPDSTTQQEVYLFDHDGPGKHLKLVPAGSAFGTTQTRIVAADALTYIPSRFTKNPTTGLCHGSLQYCYQEAPFTSPSSTEGPPLRLPVFINAGATPFQQNGQALPYGQDAVDVDGNRWMADNEYFPGPPGYRIPRYGGKNGSRVRPGNPNSIYGTVAGSHAAAYVPTFQPLQYLIDVPNGTYHVDLHFIETWKSGGYPFEGTFVGGIGSRVFTILAEKAVVISKLDVFKEVGLGVPLVKSFDATVSDDQLNLEFTRDGMISGIAVCPQSYVVAGRCQTNKPPTTGDTTPPTVSLTAPLAGTTVSGTTPINATASDAIGVTKVEFLVDGSLKTTDATTPYSFSWDTTNGGMHPCPGAHTHTLTAKAYDAAGNIGTSASVTVNMQNPPHCTVVPGDPILSVPVVSNITATSATISWTTNLPASSRVHYFGATLKTAGTEQNITTRVTTHVITLSNLASCTIYKYAASSRTATSMPIRSPVSSFTTRGCLGNASILYSTEKDIAAQTKDSITLPTDQGRSLTIGLENTVLAQDSVIQIHQLDKTSIPSAAPLPSTKHRIAGNHAYELKALSDSSSVLTAFPTTITITLTYDAADIEGLDASTLKLYRWTGTTWTATTNCIVNQTNRTLTCTTQNFSPFVVMGEQASTPTPTPPAPTPTPPTPTPSSGGGGSTPTPSSSGSYSSGGGGGGTFSGAPVVLPTPVPTPSPSSGAAGVILTRTLFRGMRIADVSRLQQFLTTQGHLAPDNITGFFGPVTEAAVQKLQCSQNIVCSGTPRSTGWGVAGRLTRSRIATLSQVDPRIINLFNLIQALQDQLAALKLKR